MENKDTLKEYRNLIESVYSLQEKQINKMENIISNFLITHNKINSSLEQYISDKCKTYVDFFDKNKFEDKKEYNELFMSKYILYDHQYNRCYNDNTDVFEAIHNRLKLIKDEYLVGIQSNFLYCTNNTLEYSKRVDCVINQNNKLFKNISSDISEYYKFLKEMDNNVLQGTNSNIEADIDNKKKNN